MGLLFEKPVADRFGLVANELFIADTFPHGVRNIDDIVASPYDLSSYAVLVGYILNAAAMDLLAAVMDTFSDGGVADMVVFLNL